MTTRQFLGCAAILLCTAALPAIAAGKSDVADAAMRGDLAAVRTLIVKKADVNAPQVDGATALHWAVHLDNAEMVEALIKAGANAKAVNRDGATPLSIAALYGNPRVVEALLKGGGHLGEGLFDASVGSRALRDLKESLSSEAEELYKPRGKTPKLNQALEVLREKTREKKESALSLRDSPDIRPAQGSP